MISQLAGKFNIDSSLGGKILDVSTDTLHDGLSTEAMSGNIGGIL